MLNGMLVVFKTLPKAIQSMSLFLSICAVELCIDTSSSSPLTDRNEMEKFYGDGIDDEDEFGEPITGSNFEEDEIEDAGDDEDVHDEDAEYLEFLASQAAAHANDAEGDEFDDDVQEEVLFESPLDEIDPYIRFSDSFRGIRCSC